LKTNLQRKRECTPLLIDPAALMDKASIDKMMIKFSEHPSYTRSIVLQLTCSFSMISNSSVS